MKDPAGVLNASGAFPSVIAVDNATPGLGTGFEELWVTDAWGFFQALMSAAGFTPSGSAETATTSQLLEAVRYLAGNPGEIVYWAGPTIPSGMRLLALEGQVIAISSYAKLVENVYCGDANNLTAPAFYKTSDAAGTTRSIAGTYMVLPDARGYFIRGIDAAGTIDPEAGRLAGATQAASIASHDHDTIKVGSSTLYAEKAASAGAAKVNLTLTPTGSIPKTSNTGTGIGTGTSNETRPDNLAFKICIRY